MGTHFSCCNINNVVQSSTKILKDVEEGEPTKIPLTTNKKTTVQKSMTKKNSIYFDKNNFINMKSKSLLTDYEILQKLGEGSYGCVYKAVHRKTELTRAIKAIKRKHIDGISFNNEISILKSVDHPSIIKLFECYYDTNYYYMIEEYCSGGDLYDYIRKQKFFSEKKAAHITLQLISSINHLHMKKIVHRDLKPENIVFIETYTDEILIKLIDFGTSIYLKSEFLTQELGTIYYIAPEVFKNHYNEKADIWSIGIILYTMLCGHPPYRGSKEEDIKKKILQGKLEFSKKDFDKVSQEAIEFITQLLDYDPVKRPTAEQAMQHKWLLKCLNSGEDNTLDNKVAQNLMKFQSAVSLQKASLAFIANQLGQYEEIQQIKDEFDKIDTNKDGILSKEELIECKIFLY
jgi:calcium-dependent protein kinase